MAVRIRKPATRIAVKSSFQRSEASQVTRGNAQEQTTSAYTFALSHDVHHRVSWGFSGHALRGCVIDVDYGTAKLALKPYRVCLVGRR